MLPERIIIRPSQVVVERSPKLSVVDILPTSRSCDHLPTLTYPPPRLIYNMSSFDFQTFLHSPSSSSVPAGGPEPISADQQEKLDELIKKFGDEGYVLEGEKLTGWEMSFLVSSQGALCLSSNKAYGQGRKLMNPSNRTSMRLYAILVMGILQCRPMTLRNFHFHPLPLLFYHHHRCLYHLISSHYHLSYHHNLLY